METKYKEIPFFKIPKFMKNLNCTIDTMIVCKVYAYGKYRPGRTAPYRCIKLWMDADMYLINTEMKLVLCGWTTYGSQFLEINSIRIYNNLANLIEFVEDMDRGCNKIIHNIVHSAYFKPCFVSVCHSMD